MDEDRISTCDCGESRTYEDLVCKGNGDLCLQKCEYYTSSMPWIIRIIYNLVNRRKPRPDCEQAEYQLLCIECGENRTK